MDRRQIHAQQLKRERAVYRYLDALENGNIDDVIAVLQQAIDDAPLDQMLAETHLSYTQTEIAQDMPIEEIDTRYEIPASRAVSSDLHSRNYARKKRHIPGWIQVLAAMVLICLLVGSLFAMVHLRQTITGGKVNNKQVPLMCSSGSWYNINTQHPGRLQNVAALSPTNAWAVGYQSENGDPTTTQTVPLIEHWDGRQWRVSSSPPVTGKLNAVTAFSSSDVWAVGTQQTAEKLIPQRTLIEHWDGRQWRIVSSPAGIALAGSTLVSELNSVTMLSPHDIWTAGETFSPILHKSWTLIEHWDGQQWHIVYDQGDQASPGWAWGVTAISDRGVWVYGHNDQLQATIERWDGNHWQNMATPQFDQPADSFFSMSVVSSHSVWAIAETMSRIGDTQVMNTKRLLVHWDGQQWNSVSTPDWLVGTDNDLSQVVALSDNDVWVAGNNLGQGSQALVAHWNGKIWQRIHLPEVTGVTDKAGTDAHVSSIAASGNAVWVVGFISGNEGSSDYQFIDQQVTCT